MGAVPKDSMEIVTWRTGSREVFSAAFGRASAAAKPPQRQCSVRTWRFVSSETHEHSWSIRSIMIYRKNIRNYGQFIENLMMTSDFKRSPCICWCWSRGPALCWGAAARGAAPSGWARGFGGANSWGHLGTIILVWWCLMLDVHQKVDQMSPNAVCIKGVLWFKSWILRKFGIWPVHTHVLLVALGRGLEMVRVSADDRRKFRSQTSDNMDRWNAEMERVREKRRVEERGAEEKSRREKMIEEKESEERRCRCAKR